MTIPFSALGLPEPVVDAVAALGYTTPTPVQQQAIPALLQGRDVLAAAQTGTGKTAAFALPVIAKMLAAPRKRTPKSVRALILAPTRELAAQIDENIRAYCAETNLKSVLVFGGVNIRPQTEALSHGCDFLVATPGRLLDHAGQLNVDLTGVEFLVLDEADRFAGDVIDLPASLCACVRFRGHHAESPAQYRRLMQFIREEGYTAAGFSREITVIDYGFTPDTEKFVTEIMIPLQKV